MFAKNEVRAFTFGPLQFSVKNWHGVFCMSDALKERIASMPASDAEQANKAAWKVKRTTGRITSRTCNMSIAGNGPVYEAAAAEWMIADEVAKQTYRRMQGGAA